MTLPPGFGERDQDRRQPEKKCRLGKSYNRGEKCLIHQWTYDHDEAWLGIRIGLIFSLVIGSIFLAIYLDHLSHIPIHTGIDQLSCIELASYVADRSHQYSYAEHRYEWLCVNEQVKEFQG